MEIPVIPNDDLMDIVEMTEKLQDLFGEILNDNDQLLAISALINASVNLIVSQIESYDEIALYRDIFHLRFSQIIGKYKDLNM